MELIYIDDITKIKSFKPMIATMGMFDGVHLGHQRIIKTLISEAINLNLASAIITFKEHPDYILLKREYNGYLTPYEEKIKLLSNYNPDYIVVFSFDEKFANLSHNEFEDILVEKLHIQKMVIGSDCHYGHLGMGNYHTLKEKIDVLLVEDYMINEEIIHSQNIRELLQKGLVEKANLFLGRNYSINGKISLGKQLGRKFNLKTANIELNNQYDFLKNGVYGVNIYLDEKKYLGIANVGHNPTFNYIANKRLEVNIFDFNDNIYGNNIIIELLFFVREEKKFSSPQELYIQIDNDIKYVQEKAGE